MGSYLHETQLYLTRPILVQGLEGVCCKMKENITTLHNVCLAEGFKKNGIPMRKTH